MKTNFVSPAEQNQPDLYDELKISQIQTIRTHFPKDEVIYFSGKVNKINNRFVSQERILLITNKAIYNIKPKAGLSTRFLFSLFPKLAVQRKINASTIDGVTVTNDASSGQFILHMKGEYDYWYDSKEHLQKIIKSLARVYFLHTQELFTMILRNENDLKEFVTTDKDFKAGRNKRASEEKLQVTPDAIESVLGFLIQKRQGQDLFTSYNDYKKVEGEGFQSQHKDHKQSQMTTFESDQIKDNTKQDPDINSNPQQPNFDTKKNINRLESIPMSVSLQVPQKKVDPQNAPVPSYLLK